LAADLNAEPLGPDLLRYLLTILANMHPRERMGARWVMSPEWWLDCRNLADSSGHPVVLPPVRLNDPECLLGLRVEIREDGGAPHLDPAA